MKRYNYVKTSGGTSGWLMTVDMAERAYVADMTERAYVAADEAEARIRELEGKIAARDARIEQLKAGVEQGRQAVHEALGQHDHNGLTWSSLTARAAEALKGWRGRDALKVASDEAEGRIRELEETIAMRDTRIKMLKDDLATAQLETVNARMAALTLVYCHDSGKHPTRLLLERVEGWRADLQAKLRSASGVVTADGVPSEIVTSGAAAAAEQHQVTAGYAVVDVRGECTVTAHPDAKPYCESV